MALSARTDSGSASRRVMLRFGWTSKRAMEGGAEASAARSRVSMDRHCFQSSGSTSLKRARPRRWRCGRGLRRRGPVGRQGTRAQLFRTVGHGDGFASRASRCDECSGGHRLFRFREIAGGVDRPAEDASDQGFARLGLGVVESVGEVCGCVFVEGTGIPGIHGRSHLRSPRLIDCRGAHNHGRPTSRAAILHGWEVMASAEVCWLRWASFPTR